MKGRRERWKGREGEGERGRERGGGREVEKKGMDWEMEIIFLYFCKFSRNRVQYITI